MVVAADGKVAQRVVQVGNAQNGRWVILSGLQAGEQVIVDGFQKVRGAGPVKPVPWKPAAAASGAASAPTAAAASGPVAAPASTPVAPASAAN